MSRAATLELDPSLKEAAAGWKARADAGLSTREQKELQAWLEADPRHRAALARFDLVWDRFDRPAQAGAAGELLEELSARSGRRKRRVISTAAGIAVLLAVGLAWQFARRTEMPAPALATNAVLRMPARQTLSDGTIAELRSGAEIATNFSGAFRRVTLKKGEVHFQVTKDAKRPFIVSAGGVEARAVGTAFSVELREKSVEVLVTEGRVAVDQPVAGGTPSTPNGIEPGPTSLAVLDAGKGIVLDIVPAGAPQLTVVSSAQMDEQLAWRAPRVEFTRTTLAEAVAVLNGYAAGRRAAGERSVQFIIEDPSIGDLRVSGLFRVDRTDAFVGLLRNGFQIEVEPRGEGELVLRRSK